MNEKFRKIDIEKRNRIINSAFEEFAKHGFDKASTNTIVKKAGISKGILFHYFGTKQALYNDLSFYAVELIDKFINSKLEWNQRDFFKRVEEIRELKIAVMEKYPYIYDFLKIVFKGKTQDEILTAVGKKTFEINGKLFTHNIDFSMFREDIDIAVFLKIFKWTFDGLSIELQNNYMERKIDIKKAKKESDKYLEVLKNLFYKKPGR